jgi:predicted metal-dependent phosphoesterase TrpH
VIDLHLHTTASDGLLAPRELVDRARTAGLSIISVTDHDTVAGIGEASDAAAAAGIRVVAGIEMTAVEQERDVHILGYFIDPADAGLESFLAEQRRDRIRRVREMADRLAWLGHPIDVTALLERVQAGDGARSVGRPALADALVAAGHAADRQDAFARLLGRGRPAFVARCGVGGDRIVEAIHRAGGIASLAHPALLADDQLVEPLAVAGLDAIEVWHSDHQPEDVERYRALAARLGLATSGGSDFHGDGVHRACRLGEIHLPPSAFAELEARAARR